MEPTMIWISRHDISAVHVIGPERVGTAVDAAALRKDDLSSVGILTFAILVLLGFQTNTTNYQAKTSFSDLKDEVVIHSSKISLFWMWWKNQTPNLQFPFRFGTIHRGDWAVRSYRPSSS